MERRPATRGDREVEAVRVLPPPEFSDVPRPGAPTASSRRTGLVLAAVAAIGALLLALLYTANDDPGFETLRPPATPAPTLAPPTTLAPTAARTVDLTSEWRAGSGIGGDGIVHDVFSGSSRAVAVGAAAGRAMVWYSAGGDRWSAADEFDAPPGLESEITAVTEWDGEWIGVGTVDGSFTVWRADNIRIWEILAMLPDLGVGDGVVDVVAVGNGLWLVGNESGRPFLWFSADGTSWKRRAPEFAPGEVELAAVAPDPDGAGLYLGGTRCQDGECHPAVWWTDNGIVWRAAARTGGEPGEVAGDPGRVVALSATPHLVVAAGEIDGRFDTQPAMWISRDGAQWSAVPASAFAPPEVEVRLADITGDEPAYAALVVGGKGVALRAGDAAATAAGEISVESVRQPAVVIRAGGGVHQLAVDESITVRMQRRIDDVVARAGFILAVGTESTPYGSKAGGLAWMSSDFGANWQLHHLPATSYEFGADFAVLRYRRMAAVSASGDSWIHELDTSGITAAAESAVKRFVGGALAGDVSVVVESLAPLRPERGEIRLPGISQFDIDWWRADDGLLDVGAIAGALDYLVATETEVRLYGCDADLLWGDVERVRIRCEFELESALVATMGLTTFPGRLTAIVGAGSIESVTAPSVEPLWNRLAWWAWSEDAALAAATFADPLAGGGGAAPPPTGTLAVAALDWATRYQSAFFVPGAVLETATPLGPIEWTLSDVFVGGRVEWLVAARGALWAMVADDPFEWSSRDQALWTSLDGVAWEEVGGAPSWGEWWNEAVFADRLVVAGSGEWGPELREWTGAGWSEIEVEPASAAGDWWPHPVVESSGHVLLLAEGFVWPEGVDDPEERPLGRKLWIETEDGSFDLVELDGPHLRGSGRTEIVATDEGFVMFAGSVMSSGFVETMDLDIWTSRNGVDWELLTDDLRLEANWIESFDIEGGELVIVAYDGEVCEAAEDGNIGCRPQWTEWRSADGVGWRSDESDGPGWWAATATGPRGTVRVLAGEDSYYRPDLGPQKGVTVSVGRTGEPLVPLTDLEVRIPAATWHEVGHAAMGEATVVAVIQAERETGEEEYYGQETWLLVGRFLEAE